MEFIIDTAQLDAIKKCAEFYPIDGVTTNPTIISREHTDFKKLICEIRFLKSVCSTRCSTSRRHR